MPKAIRFHQTGGPEVLRWEEVEVPAPGPGEVRLRQVAVGLNFIDTYHRSGLYPLPLPAIPGVEGVGHIEALGPGVEGVRVGDRVACLGPLGAYAQERNVPADRLIPLPEGLGDLEAGAMMLQGLTAWFLLRRTHRVQPGETVLVHAAAGGVGLVLCQWARHLGATVIGTVGSEEKARLAREHGCAHTLLYREEDVPARVRELTGGQGVPVVYDGVGKDTWTASLDCLAPLGLMVSFGNASGPVPPVDLLSLTARGSLFVTRPTLFTYVAKREELLAGARELFDVVLGGTVRIPARQTFPLREAAAAHRELEARRTTGSTVLLPEA